MKQNGIFLRLRKRTQHRIPCQQKVKQSYIIVVKRRNLGELITSITALKEGKLSDRNVPKWDVKFQMPRKNTRKSKYVRNKRESESYKQNIIMPSNIKYK